jgi:hypothetical protein
MRGGPVALFYHLFYAGLYVGLGVRLWQARPWGYTLVLFATGVYTLDRLQLLLFRKAVLADLLRKPGPIGEVLAAVDSHLLVAVFTAVPLMILLCWWGFAVYAYLRRDYFSNAYPGSPSAFYFHNRPVCCEMFFTVFFSSTTIISITPQKNNNLFYNNLRHKYCCMNHQHRRRFNK